MVLMTADGTKPNHVDSLVRYVRMQRGDRFFAVYFDDGTVKVGPKGQRDLDIVILHSIEPETWRKLRDSLETEKVEIFEFEGLSVATDRLPGQTPPIDPVN